MTAILELEPDAIDSPAACRGRQNYQPEAASDAWRIAFRLVLKAGEILVDEERYGEASAVFLTAALLPARTALAFHLGRPGIHLSCIEDGLTKLRSSSLIDRELHKAFAQALKAPPHTPKGAQNAADVANALFEIFGDAGLPDTRPPRDQVEARQVYGVSKRFTKFDCTPRLPPWKARAK